ncbi:MAG TPA: ribosomal protein S18-alanine N-acetyltransferase [Gemmatimonadaceae bacterium]
MAARAKLEAVTIRPAEDGDLDDVAAIERSVFNDPWSRRSFVDLVGERQVVFLVAVDGTAVVGYAIALLTPPESELANLAVSRLMQHQGLGRRLLVEVMSEAQGRGAREMFLEVRASNASAIALYSAEGFTAVGRRVRYYARPIEDAVVMRAALRQG